MARKRRIWQSKIRVRSFLRRHAEMEVHSLDRFLAHVRDAATAQRRSIERRAVRLPAEVQEFLADDLHELDAICDLSDQIAIVALYRAVEINTGRILSHQFGAAAGRNASSIGRSRAFLKQHGINLDRIPHFRAVNELRLLNNAIKHAAHVTAELANEANRSGRRVRAVERTYPLLHLSFGPSRD